MYDAPSDDEDAAAVAERYALGWGAQAFAPLSAVDVRGSHRAVLIRRNWRAGAFGWGLEMGGERVWRCGVSTLLLSLSASQLPDSSCPLLDAPVIPNFFKIRREKMRGEGRGGGGDGYPKYDILMDLLFHSSPDENDRTRRGSKHTIFWIGGYAGWYIILRDPCLHQNISYGTALHVSVSTYIVLCTMYLYTR